MQCAVCLCAAAGAVDADGTGHSAGVCCSAEAHPGGAGADGPAPKVGGSSCNCCTDSTAWALRVADPVLLVHDISYAEHGHLTAANLPSSSFSRNHKTVCCTLACSLYHSVIW
jgi:hypothetical protein